MAASSAHNPHLRLISENPLRMEAWRREQNARDAIARENRAAASSIAGRSASSIGAGALDPHDPRWVLAVRAYSQLQGSTMTPQRRERVLKTAKQLGVRVFDASLIIAIAQDHARRGEGLASAQPMLRMIPAQDARPRSAWVTWAGAFALAAAGAAIMIWWLLSA